MSVWGLCRGCCLPDAYTLVAAALCTGVLVPPLGKPFLTALLALDLHLLPQ